MWNWKCMGEDKVSLFFCDIDTIIDTEADEEGYYHSESCYQGPPARFAVWTSIFLKDSEAVRCYAEERKRAGLDTEGYDQYNHTLCITEIDGEKGWCRVIPAQDYNSDDGELGVSTLLSKEASILKGIPSEWTPIKSRKVNKALRNLHKFFFPPCKD